GGVGGGGCAGRAGCAGGGDGVDAGDGATDGAVGGRGLERASPVATARWSASALSDLPIQESRGLMIDVPRNRLSLRRCRCNGAFQERARGSLCVRGEGRR